MDEVAYPLPRAGLTLRGQRSGPGRDGPPVLCLHGWLDNSASFEPLARRLPDIDVVALDLPGHGLSDPLRSTTCQYLDYVLCVLELAHTQGWDRFRLVGHSLGAELAVLLAGTAPEKVERLVLVDAIGPLPTSPAESRNGAGRYIEAYLADPPPPVYRSRQHAIRMRLQLADILLDTATRLVERDLREVPGGLTWRADPRLKYPSTRSFTEDQVLDLLRAISAPTQLVVAERTTMTEEFYPQRIAAVPDLTQVTLPGSHHLHMENPDAVAGAVGTFLGAGPIAQPAS